MKHSMNDSFMHLYSRDDDDAMIQSDDGGPRSQKGSIARWRSDFTIPLHTRFRIHDSLTLFIPSFLPFFIHSFIPSFLPSFLHSYTYRSVNKQPTSKRTNGRAGESVCERAAHVSGERSGREGGRTDGQRNGNLSLASLPSDRTSSSYSPSFFPSASCHFLSPRHNTSFF